MIVDTSAVLTILKREYGWEAFSHSLEASNQSFMSAATYFEASILVDRWKNGVLSRRYDELIDQAHIVLEPVTAEQARVARQAYRDFGKGSGHAAQLNFGDCFSYALAREKREPILFRGHDFVHTDLRSALRQ
jgi:ribonuclease VapC